MQKDPRFRNRTFNHETIRSYLSDYSSALQNCLDSVSHEALSAASQLMRETRANGGRIFVGGNGGSAAIAEHLSCDWEKGCHLSGKKGLHVHCLTSNTALLTAISNDFGYAESFAYQLELAEPTPKDVVLLISSSGNSENVIKAAEMAQSKSCTIIGLTGFTGGKLKAMANISLHIPFENYGLVEDAHQVLMHVLAQFHDLKNREGI